MADKLLTILQSTGLPVAYLMWAPDRAPTPPYIIYFADDSRNFAADNVVYHGLTNFVIELYTDYKDPNTEQLIVDALTEADIYYSTTETYIESEQLYQVVFRAQI